MKPHFRAHLSLIGWGRHLTRIVLLVSLLSSAACDKSQPDDTPKPDDCQPPGRSEYQYQYWYDRPWWSYSCALINPRNSDQYLMISSPPRVDSSYFKRYSASVPGDSTEMFSGRFVTALPVWSTRNWLAYTTGAGEIMLLKANGDSSRALGGQIPEPCLSPQWMPDGVHLLYGQQTTHAVGALWMLNTKTMERQQVGEDRYVPYGYAVSPDGKQIATSEIGSGGLVLYDLPLRMNAGRLLVPLSAAEQNEPSEGGVQVAWAWDANVIFWTFGNDLYRTNPVTGVTIKLRDGCINRSYQQVTAASDASFVIATKYEQKYLGNDSLRIRVSAWKIAGDGSWEERLPKR